MTRAQIRLTLAALGVAMASVSVFAQNPEEIRVEATRVIDAKVVGRSSTGIPERNLSLTTVVSVAGLDLATNSGAKEAEKRVSDAALSGCREIGQKYPDATPDDRACAKSATDKAMVRVHQLVLAAEQSATRK